MKTNMREEAIIPQFAVESFKHAFIEATQSNHPVVFVRHGNIVKQYRNGQCAILKDVTAQYVDMQLKKTVLKRKAKREALV
ncbi:hypothetical protein [Acinetobacter stercoris]|nr:MULTISPECIES: hypothetical protein [Acinetobacter]